MRLKKRVRDTLKNTHFSVKPVKYVFETELGISDIVSRIGNIGDVILKRVRTYTAMAGYCRGNKLTLFRIAWSVRFLIIARPFQAYMYKDERRTRISGSFGFSISTMIVAFAWLLNDTVRLINKLRAPVPEDFAGHIISIAILSTLLFRTIWQDKKQQQTVIEFMKKELDADLVEG